MVQTEAQKAELARLRGDKADLKVNLPKTLKELTKALEQLKGREEKNAETVKTLTATIEKMKDAAKEKRQEQAAVTKKGWKAKIEASPHKWVKVFNVGLVDGVDFSFMFEGLTFRLLSGTPVSLSELVIEHLQGCGRPQLKLKQGEAGQSVQVAGFHHNFNVVGCRAPEKAEPVAVAS